MLTTVPLPLALKIYTFQYKTPISREIVGREFDRELNRVMQNILVLVKRNREIYFSNKIRNPIPLFGDIAGCIPPPFHPPFGDS